eukprot:1192168-Prorocentrum_minimum.AAC.2
MNTIFYGSSCANNGKGALNNPDSIIKRELPEGAYRDRSHDKLYHDITSTTVFRVFGGLSCTVFTTTVSCTTHHRTLQQRFCTSEGAAVGVAIFFARAKSLLECPVVVVQETVVVKTVQESVLTTKARKYGSMEIRPKRQKKIRSKKYTKNRAEEIDPAPARGKRVERCSPRTPRTAARLRALLLAASRLVSLVGSAHLVLFEQAGGQVDVGGVAVVSLAEPLESNALVTVVKAHLRRGPTH